MKGIILHTRKPVNKKYFTHFDYVSADFLFSHFEELKARFSHRSIYPHEVCTKEFQVLVGQ